VAGDRKGKKLVLSTALAVAMFPIALVGPLFETWRSLGIYTGSSPASRPAQ
jgi:multiple sugar transport system permease protein